MTVAAVILAAGQGTRFQAATGRPDSKLLALAGGVPLVRRVAAVALAAKVDPVIVVLGYQPAAVRTALAGLRLVFVANPGFVAGLSGSLKVGLAAVPVDKSGALVLLGDMPGVSRGTLDALVARHEAVPEADAVVPVWDGGRGNPVLLGRSLFAAVAGLDGDAGARRLLAVPGVHVEEVAAASAAILDDVDHPDDLHRGSSPQPGLGSG